MTQAKPNCSTDICSNPNGKHIGHMIDKCFKPGGGLEGQYPDWWKKKGTAARSGTLNINQQQNHTVIPPKPMANVATVPTTSFTPCWGTHKKVNRCIIFQISITEKNHREMVL